jgi:hypothetical protein
MTTISWQKAADAQIFSWDFTFYFYPPDQGKV